MCPLNRKIRVLSTAKPKLVICLMLAGLLVASPAANAEDARVKLLQDIRAQAKVLKDNDKPEDAAPLFLCAVRLDEQLYGPTDARLEPDLEDLAWSYRQTIWQFNTSEIYATRQFLLSAYNALGPNDSDPGQRARDLEGIADNYLHEGNLSCAAQLYGRSVALSEKADSKNAPDLLAQMSKHTWSLRKQYDHENADRVLTKLVAKVEQMFGKQPSSSAVFSTEGSSEMKNELYDEAEASFTKALNADMKALGAENAWAGIDCLQIAQQLLLQDKEQRADQIAGRAHATLMLAGYEKPNVMGSVMARKQLARAYEKCGEDGLAEEAWTKCVSVASKSETDMLDSCLRGQANYYSSKGDYLRAAEILEKVLANYEKQNNKPSLRSSVMRDLAKAYDSAQNVKRAEDVYSRLIEDGEKDKQRTSLMIALHDYSKFLKRSKRLAEAEHIDAKYEELLKGDR